MAQIHSVIDELVKRYGGNNTDIAKKLSEYAEKKGERKISPQRIGQYRRGERTPKPDFILLWEEVFGDRIMDLMDGSETKVSKETIKKGLPFEEEREILIRNIDRMGETNEYLLRRIRELEGGLKGDRE